MSKSKVLIIVYILLTISLLGAYSYIYTLWRKDFSPAEFMSDNSTNFYIEQVKMPDLTGNFLYKDLIDLLNSEKNSLLFFSEYGANENGKGVYFKNSKNFSPNILYGRNFSEEDFLNKTNTILIDKNLINYCIKNEDVYYYTFDGYEYEVIGIYEKETYDANYYINFSSKNMEENILNGAYFLDVEGVSSDYYHNFLEKIISSDLNFQNGMSIMINQGYNQKNLLYFIQYILKGWRTSILCLLPTFLILINISIIFNLWLKGMKENIFAKYVVGINTQKLKKEIIRINMLFCLIAYIIGLMIFKFLETLKILRFSTFNINIDTIIFSSIVYFIITLIFSLKLYKVNLTKYFSEIGGEWY